MKEFPLEFVSAVDFATDFITRSVFHLIHHFTTFSFSDLFTNSRGAIGGEPKKEIKVPTRNKFSEEKN